MHYEIKLQKVGDRIGAVLPEEVLAHLKAAEGDTLLWVETPTGINVVHATSEVARMMAIAEGISRRYENTLRTFAKS